MPTHQDDYEAAIVKLVNDFRQAVAAQAAIFHVSEDALTKASVSELLGEERYADGRANEWNARLRLYDSNRLCDPEVDSDADLPPEAPGATIVRGLPAVLTLIAGLASTYHGAACAGLDITTLKRKARNLRTQLSNRGDGIGTIRAEYEVNKGSITRYMLLRCDVKRLSRGWPDNVGNTTPTGFRRIRTLPTADYRQAW